MGTLDQHIVVVEIPPGRQVEDYEPLIESLARRYRALPTVADLQYRLPNPLEMMTEILPRALLLLTPAELDRVAAALGDARIEQSVAENRQTLRTPQGIMARELVQNDPFHLLPIFLDKFKSAGGGFRLDASSGYFLSADRSTLLMLVQPRRPAQDIPFGRRFMASAPADRARGPGRSPREAGPGVPAPRIGYTGGYAISLYDAELIQKDVIYNVIFSCVGGARPLPLRLPPPRRAPLRRRAHGAGGGRDLRPRRSPLRPALLVERRLRRPGGGARGRLHHRALWALRGRARPRRRAGRGDPRRLPLHPLRRLLRGAHHGGDLLLLPLHRVQGDERAGGAHRHRHPDLPDLRALPAPRPAAGDRPRRRRRPPAGAALLRLRPPGPLGDRAAADDGPGLGGDRGGLRRRSPRASSSATTSRTCGRRGTRAWRTRRW